MQAAEAFVPVFIDTLNDLETTKRFAEKYGSYPVLRVHDLKGRDIGGRIDTNRTAGIVGGDGPDRTVQICSEYIW